jgi:hypothetical protein
MRMAMAALLAASACGAARGDIVYLSQERGAWSMAAIGSETDTRTAESASPGVMDATADAFMEINSGFGPVSSRGVSRIRSDLSPGAITVLGTYTLSPGAYFGTGAASARTYMNIVFRLTQPASFEFITSIPGVPFDYPPDPTPRVARLTGAGVDISAPAGDSTITGTLAAGDYTYRVDVLSRYPGPAGDNSPGFAITGFSATLNVLPAPGTLAALAVTGAAVLRRRR